MSKGYFGAFGGAYIPEILHETFAQLTLAYETARADEAFWRHYIELMRNYSGRPTPLTFAENLSLAHGKRRIYIKREDLNQTGAHKANNVMGQGLLVRRMGKTRVIAETGAGQHGVATATMAARLGLACTIYMGAKDVARQRPNVFWMEQLGATVIPVTSGSQTLKDAVNEAMRDWVGSMDNTHYVLGTACGAHPFPEMVSWFQSVIGQEARVQILEQEGRLPDHVYACVGGGSNAMGIFQGFLEDPQVELIGVEAGGLGLAGHNHASRIASGKSTVGIAQGYKTCFLQDEDGQMRDTHSVAAGLDYVGVSPILADLHQQGRVRFEAATDVEVVEALKRMVKSEGIIPALESSHAVAGALRELPQLKEDAVVIINLSGRGDKDIFTIAEALGDAKWKTYIQERAAIYAAEQGERS
ncbi:tryptophan synthase, beta chain [Magnetococcus marinus MC-1]|uniref:Tryptophan synthase beta chain n=1 Tax=Magnetococcus marinus (strain ATCC BAA-1437 / JCM 17883 / MC-1) TaxID=156889 RepID=A0L4H0_MAGMM|nr:tryptophan synthase subunit beta [Magnetococcus marinus]ABK42863.1 tryptophan synthase, beta chain [Magnetococcus marinus MC-1]